MFSLINSQGDATISRILLIDPSVNNTLINPLLLEALFRDIRQTFTGRLLQQTKVKLPSSTIVVCSNGRNCDEVRYALRIKHLDFAFSKSAPRHVM